MPRAERRKSPGHSEGILTEPSEAPLSPGYSEGILSTGPSEVIFDSTNEYSCWEKNFLSPEESQILY